MSGLRAIRLVARFMDSIAFLTASSALRLFGECQSLDRQGGVTFADAGDWEEPNNARPAL